MEKLNSVGKRQMFSIDYYYRTKMPACNERFGVMAAEARRNGSANLKVCTPQEVQWKPPLRQAATTLSASGGQCAGGQRNSKIEVKQNI